MKIILRYIKVIKFLSPQLHHIHLYYSEANHIQIDALYYHSCIEDCFMDVVHYMVVF